ncbi:MAG: DUF1800 domain-containing protein [Williamsia sp.]|nr:DUF1800 domain-containing protein [Williamsia sp.]
MDRREFLTAKRRVRSHVSLSSAVNKTSTGSGLAPYTGNWGIYEVVHLLARTMFGAKKADIDYFKTKSLSAAVDELLNPTAPLPSPPVKEYATSTTTGVVADTNVAVGDTWINDPSTDGTVNSQRRTSFKRWWTGVMINQDRSVREKMTLFWANHFSTLLSTINYAHFFYRHHNLLRENALGNFRTLIRLVTLDPGMLIDLNGRDSSSAAPNENYGRELQELYTLGKENNPNYTENDVKAAAKVLTGWQLTVNSTAPAYFTLSRHDKTNKQFSSFYNNTIITGRSANPANYTAGEQEIDDMLTMIFNKKVEVSRFIVKKLYRWFCYYKIDSDVQANVIDPLALILQNNNWDIKPVLSTLFKSEHFFDAAYRGCMIKSPVDMTIGLAREFNLAITDANYGAVTSTLTDTYNSWEYLRAQTASFNQDIGEPRDVAGWPAYYQDPQYHELWINSDTLPKRNKLTDLLIGTTGYTVNSTSKFYMKINPVLFTTSLPDPSNPINMLNDTLDIFLKVSLSDASKQTIKTQILLKGQMTDQYWTDAWNAYVASPAVTGTPYKTVLSILQALYKYIMNLAEYQLS